MNSAFHVPALKSYSGSGMTLGLYYTIKTTGILEGDGVGGVDHYGDGLVLAGDFAASEGGVVELHECLAFWDVAFGCGEVLMLYRAEHAGCCFG